MRKLSILLLAITIAFPLSAADPVVIATDYVQANRVSLGLTDSDIADMIVNDQYATRHNGVTHVYFKQRLSGIEVFNGILNVNVAPDGTVAAAGNRFDSNLTESINTATPAITAEQAVASAADHLGIVSSGALVVKTLIGGEDQEVIFAAGTVSLDDIPVKLMFLPREDGSARLVWDLRIQKNEDEYWQMEIDAVDGAVLEKMNLVQSDTYSVYAWPAESPNHVTGSNPLPPGDGRTIVTEAAAHAQASPFGWHDLNGLAGADTLDTTGNNVFAQTDVDNNNVFSPPADTRPISGSRDFVHPLDLSSGPASYRNAAVTNLFYWNNFIHDVHWLYGFDEPSGNFQINNYARGGVGNDAIQADAQDGSGTNNANMLTLPEGTPPRMQMFVWTGRPSVVINSPSTIAGEIPAAAAAFGKGLDAVGITGDVEVVNDGSSNPSQGCAPLVGFTPGRIALIDRGTCEFGLKVKNAEDAGASAAIIVNNAGDDLVTMAPGASGGSVTISSVFIGQTNGGKIKNELASSTVNVTLKKVFVDRDSDLDNGVIAHEYGHGVSIRLTGGPLMVTCLSGSQQAGEGWSDWWALALTQRAGATGAEPRGIGTYVVFQDPATGKGIRPFPYSTDMSINPQTYGDLTKGTLSVPHGVGTVWAMATWEMYWAIVNGVPEMGLPGAGFRENIQDMTPPLAGNQIAMRLVMDGLKLQPCAPTMLNARDAILKADQISNGGAYQCHIWAAFAKRGMGVNAKDGGRSSSLAVTEDFTVPASCNVLPVAVDDSATTSEDYSVTIFVLGNDSDSNGDTMSVTSAGSPSNGTAVVNGDNTVTYTPHANFHGTDAFSYTISDGRGGSDSAIVTVTVTPVNDVPVAGDDAASTEKNTPVDIAVLTNDSDVDGDTLSVSGTTAPSNGRVSINADGTVKYTPNSGFSGTDTFEYVASDGNGGAASAKVTVSVAHDNRG